MSRVHSRPQERSSIPACAAVLMAALLSGCVSSEEAAEMAVARTQPSVYTDPETGCEYLIFSRGSYGENSVTRSDRWGQHKGCNATTATTASSVGTKDEVRSEPNPTETGRMEP